MEFVRGQLIADRYCLINRIGQGALGELWRAADRVPERQVTIRRVASFGRGETRKMLMELDASRAVRERCIARVHRVGMLADGAAFVATELLVSESLDDLLERRGRLSPGAALSLVGELARAVASAHERRIAHCAITPRAILLARDERSGITPKLLDFGRAAVLEPIAPYASPEQLTDDSGPGYESDVWALGVLLLRCVTGAAPFRTLSDAFDAERYVSSLEVHEHIRGVLLATLRPGRSDRMTASVLADTAQLLAWRVPGGFRDLEKMVRIHAPLWLDAAESAPIDHFPTIPSLGGGPPPRDTDAPTALPGNSENDDDFGEIRSGELEIVTPLPQAEPEAPSAPHIDDDLPPAAYLTPVPDDVFVDFRPRRQRRHVVYACLGAAAMGMIIGAISNQTSRRPPRAAHARVATPVAETRPRVVAAPVAVTAAAKPAAPAKRAVLEEPEPAKPKLNEKDTARPKKKEHATGSAPISPMAGIPLWDPPKTPPVDDNPYK